MRRTRLAGSLAVPSAAIGVALVAVESRSHLRDPLRLRLADYFHQERLATLVIAVNPDDEAAPGVESLTERVEAGLAWIASEPRLQDLPVGVLADGAAVVPAMVAMARDPERVHGFVGCGGEPDEAGDVLPRVAAPTLLVVGGFDTGGLESARRALERLPGHADLAVIDDTSDPLAGPEGLAAVARVAGRWLLDHLAPAVS